MQLIGAATSDFPNQTPMPQPSKQLLNACPVPPMHIIATLLAGCQSAIISSNERHNDMNPAFISTVMAPNFEIKEITSGTRRSIPIPNQNIRGCPGSQGANPYNVAQHINGNSHLVNMRRILRIPRVGTPYPANGTDGHGVCVMCHIEWKMGTMVERIQPVGPLNLLNNVVKVFANTGNTLPLGNLRTFRVRHESTALCWWGVFHRENKIKTTTHGRGARGAYTSSKIPPMFLHLHPSVQPGYAHRWTYTVSPTIGHHHPKA